MIGNSDDARQALVDYRGRDNTRVLSRNGSTRVVYLINGVVYKVDKGDNESNEAEYSTINLCVSDLPEGMYFPDVSLFRILGEDVIAMEYVPGIPFALCNCAMMNDTCTTMCPANDAERALLEALPIGYDSNGLNFIRTARGVCMIDAGN